MLQLVHGLKVRTRSSTSNLSLLSSRYDWAHPFVLSVCVHVRVHFDTHAMYPADTTRLSRPRHLRRYQFQHLLCARPRAVAHDVKAPITSVLYRTPRCYRQVRAGPSALPLAVERGAHLWREPVRIDTPSSGSFRAASSSMGRKAKRPSKVGSHGALLVVTTRDGRVLRFGFTGEFHGSVVRVITQFAFPNKIDFVFAFYHW